MRFNSNNNRTTIEVVYHQKRFQYFRSKQKIINPWIDIHLALRNCFREEPVRVSCFFNRKKHNNHWKRRLKPSDDIFYQIASEMFVVKKSLDALFAASFEDLNIVRLCLELTKHPWYQSIEKQHQHRKKIYESGYLSRLETSQQVAKRLYKIFQLHYHDLHCEEIEQAIAIKRKPTAKSPVSPLAIYPIKIF
jgi:hypothetical protein